MKRTDKQLNEILDRVSREIRDDSVDSTVVKGVTDRVMVQLSSEREQATPEAAHVEHIRGCEDFQKLIPSYLRGSLSSARTMLLEDHTQECIPCRKALKQARLGRQVSAPSLGQGSRRISRPMAAKWAIAAALIAAVSIGSAVLVRRSGRSAAVYAMVESVYGPVYRVSNTESEALANSEKLGTGERIRTAKDAGAVVRLPDGSSIEMKERSEFSVTESSQGVTIHLERGNIIVQAAKQRSGNLFVSTNDCLVSVKGTIFSVNNGTKGSRVSVIEGEVHVDHNGEQDVLKPGDQISTSQSIEAIPVKDEVAWSRDRERYSKMLAEIDSIRREIDAKAPRPEVRYSTRLLDMAPAGTVLYVALPNLSATLSESHRIIEERIQQNPALSEWWQKEQGSRKGFNQILDKVREVGEYLGDEITVSATMDGNREPNAVVVLAELKNGSGFRSYLEQQIESATAGAKRPAVHFVEDPMTATATSPEYSKTHDGVYIWINGDVFAAAPQLAALRQVAEAAKTSAGNRFSESSFYARIAELYRDGAGVIIAADLQAIIGEGSRTGKGKEGEAFRQLGITNLKHFIFELKDVGGKAQNRAVVTFDKTERGLASWLAAPGPMGALQFISPDANVVAAFVVKEPVGLVDDLLGALRNLDPTLWQHLKDGEAEHGIDIRNDFAAPLGGEFAFAVDGPLLPVPSWKLIFEVNDQAHLQQTFERIVNKLNQYAARDGKKGFEWERTASGDRTFFTLKSVDFGLSVTYTYANGYLVAGPSRALVDRAVRYRESGYTLLQSPRFVAALPEDKNANFSALFYQNLASVLGPVARQLGGAKGMPEEGRNRLKSLADAAPALAYAYAQDDRIIFSANGEDGPLGLKPSSLMGLPGSFGLAQIFGEAMH